MAKLSLQLFLLVEIDVLAFAVVVAVVADVLVFEFYEIILLVIRLLIF